MNTLKYWTLFLVLVFSLLGTSSVVAGDEDPSSEERVLHVSLKDGGGYLAREYSIQDGKLELKVWQPEGDETWLNESFTIPLGEIREMQLSREGDTSPVGDHHGMMHPSGWSSTWLWGGVMLVAMTLMMIGYSR